MAKVKKPAMKKPAQPKKPMKQGCGAGKPAKPAKQRMPNPAR